MTSKLFFFLSLDVYMLFMRREGSLEKVYSKPANTLIAYDILPNKDNSSK